MKQFENTIAQMRSNPTDVRFSDLGDVCDHYFGKSRQGGASHRIYRTPWQDDPRVNIQSKKGKAGAYQVRQVLKAIERLECEHGSER